MTGAVTVLGHHPQAMQRRLRAQTPALARSASAPARPTRARADGLDRLLVARQEVPARTRVVALGERLQGLRRVALRIDADGEHHHLAPDPVAEVLPHLRQTRRPHRADARAGRVDEVDQHDLVPEQVVVEADLLPVLLEQRQVGEVGTAAAIRGGGARRLLRRRLGQGLDDRRREEARDGVDGRSTNRRLRNSTGTKPVCCSLD